MEHHMRKVKLAVILIIVFLLYLSLSSVFNSEASLNSPKGIINAVYVYFGWLGQTIGNLWDIGVDTAHTVGNAIKINSTA